MILSSDSDRMGYVIKLTQLNKNIFDLIFPNRTLRLTYRPSELTKSSKVFSRLKLKK